jgi:hypothetical protein
MIHSRDMQHKQGLNVMNLTSTHDSTPPTIPPYETCVHNIEHYTELDATRLWKPDMSVVPWSLRNNSDTQAKDQSGIKTRERYELLDTAQNILRHDHHTINFCSRRPFHDAEHITLDVSDSGASFGGLHHCKNPFVCPVCSAHVALERADQLRYAYETWIAGGGSVAMLTLTLSHQINDSCSLVFDRLNDARKRFFDCRSWRNFKHEHFVEHYVRATEITYGENGYHWHNHILIFFAHDEPPSADKIYRELAGHWIRLLNKVGASAQMPYAMDFLTADQDVASYIAKFGKEPSGTWGLALETVGGAIKRGTDKSGLSLMQLLKLAHDGDDQAARIYRAIALASSGKSQLHWSHGAKAILLDGYEDQADQESEEPETKTIAVLPLDFWYHIVRRNARGVILELASNADYASLMRLLDDLSDELQMIRKRKNVS